MSDVRWTSKAPALIGGIILIVAGLVSTWRRAAVLGLVLIGLGAAFIGYSMTVKDWCEIHGPPGFGGGFGGGFQQCLKAKGWLAF